MITSSNKLKNEASPYLQQHSHNPVHWFPWGNEALRKAEDENKMIFLSIGYSSCHWCHVMAHESFEDSATAAILNDHFISIKVDREERPDLDDYYMKAVQMMTGKGGWPLSVFLTPKLQVFFGGTYFPPVSMHQMPAFKDVLSSLIRAWGQKREEINSSAVKIEREIGKLDQLNPRTIPEVHLADGALLAAVSSFDGQHGGFGNAPKFPQPPLLSFLLRFYSENRDERAGEMVETTLTHMARGGIFDQLGGGFHRYSVDREWLVPHFEKMLYDNALLSRLYSEAFTVFDDPLYRDVADAVFKYVLREMCAKEGGFYTAQDADTEGEEGRYYLWSREEISTLLSPAEMKIAGRLFDLRPEGNWEGKTLLRMVQPLAEAAASLNISEGELKNAFEPIVTKLLKAREKRTRPGIDDKILTDWNSLMISAFSTGGRLLRNTDYIKAAEKAARFILDQLQDDNRLCHTNKIESPIPGFLDDYAYFTAALLDLYEATFDPEWLSQALAIHQKTLALFYDENGGFFFNSSDHTDFRIRSKKVFDGPVPSGNSIAVQNCLRLGAYTNRSEYRKISEKSLLLYQDTMQEYPLGSMGLFAAHEHYLAEEVSIIVAGNRKDAPVVAAMKKIQSGLFVHAVTGHTDSHVSTDYLRQFPLLQDKHGLGDEAMIYICRDSTCLPPLKDANDIRHALR